MLRIRMFLVVAFCMDSDRRIAHAQGMERLSSDRFLRLVQLGLLTRIPPLHVPILPFVSTSRVLVLDELIDKLVWQLSCTECWTFRSVRIQFLALAS